MKPTVESQGRGIDPAAFYKSYLRAAGALRACGVHEDDVVALMMRNGPDALEVTLAARWIGALWCPVKLALQD